MLFSPPAPSRLLVLSSREQHGYRSAQGGGMMPGPMRQQGMGGPNVQMNMPPGGGMGGMNRGYGPMNEQSHMGQMGGGSMYGGNGGGGGGRGGMGNRMMQMNQMNQLNQMGQMNQMNQMGHQMNHTGPGNHSGMQQHQHPQQQHQHPQQPPFQSSGGYGLGGMNSPLGSPRMIGPQQGLLMSPRNRGSPKMGASQYSPGGTSIRGVHYTFA